MRKRERDREEGKARERGRETERAGEREREKWSERETCFFIKDGTEKQHYKRAFALIFYPEKNTHQ